MAVISTLGANSGTLQGYTVPVVTGPPGIDEQLRGELLVSAHS